MLVYVCTSIASRTDLVVNEWLGSCHSLHRIHEQLEYRLAADSS